MLTLHDPQHVWEKFQGAPDYLIERLGKSNSRRRQLLKYHKRHKDIIIGHQEFSLENTIPVNTAQMTDEHQNQPDVLAIIEEPQLESHPGTIGAASSAVPTHTTLSTIVNSPTGPDFMETDSDTGQSNTSFASSASGVKRLSIPPPSDKNIVFDGRAFQCNYCFSIVKIKSRKAWM
jgi:hypothetical protein